MPKIQYQQNGSSWIYRNYNQFMQFAAIHIDDEGRQHEAKQSPFRLQIFPEQAFLMVNLYPGQDVCDPYDNI